MKTLGATLKKYRESIPLTLRQVEEVSGISNAYLSQLENEKIKKPSANILYKLSSLYKIDLNVLLAAAGIIEQSKEKADPTNQEWMNRIAFYSDQLSDSSRKEILDFIKFKISNA